jgi:rhomboid protease GluP
MEDTKEIRGVFRASWGSGVVWLGVFMVACSVGMLYLAFPMSSATWFLSVLAAFFGLMAWFVLRPLVGGQPVLSVGRQGVSGYLLKGHLVPWTEIADIQHLSIQGQDQLQISLQKGAPSLALTRSWTSSGVKRGIALSPLRGSDRKLAIQTVIQAFHRYASDQSMAAARSLMDEAKAAEEFDVRLRSLTPTPWALYAVIAVNVLVWVLNLFDGMSPMQPTSADLFAWGANSATAVVRDGEYWRLLTATALHGGVLHLGLNMFALWDAGRRVCQWFGNGQFLLIYLGAGLAGSALSLHFSSQQAVSVGASGAVFGVLGALLVGVYQHRASVPKAMATQLLTSQGMFVALMLVQGFARPGIDNAAHVGGLVVGALMAWLLIELIDEHATLALRQRRQLLAVGATAVVVGALVWLAQPGVDHRQLFGSQDSLTQLLPRMKSVEAALQQDAKDHKAGRLSEPQLIDAMEQRHIPAYRAIHQEMTELGPLPHVPAWADIRELHGIVLEVMTLEVGKHRSTVDIPQTNARLKVLSDRMASVGARLRAKKAPAAKP